ncbi:MAG: papain-like cysteine protease family protein [Hormoscilla sp.]
MSNSDYTVSGAGGNWPVIDEGEYPTVIQQQNRLSCGPASAEMLLRIQGVNNLTQEIIASETGVPVTVPDLALALNRLDPSSSRQWIGGGLEIPGASFAEVLEVLTATGPWIAELREPGARLGHLVVVNGFDALGRIEIADPWNRTQYKMDKDEFLQYWTLQGIYLRKL